MKFLKDLSKKDLFGKVCILRVDLNIAEREAKNNLRIISILPTIKFLIKNGAKVILLSHRGRPNQKSKLQFKIQNFSLKPFAGILSRLLNEKVNFISLEILKDCLFSCLFSYSQECWNELFNNSKSKIFLLENLRFFEGEEKNDEKFAERLASLGDLYINDAFSVSHRKAASVFAITKFLPSCAGFLLEKEINNLNKVCGISRNERGMTQKNIIKRPFIIILGGAKISDKIELIKNFLNCADYFLIGGGIAHNFLLAQGLPIGESIFEKSTIGFARKILKNKKIILPVDYIIDKNRILDIGPRTAELYSDIIKKAKTIIWNGPMGYFEDKKFAKGSEAVVKAILNNKKTFAVVGGGETVSLFNLKPKTKKLKSNLFVSTGGGAMLEYLAAKKLPGIIALSERAEQRGKLRGITQKL